MDSALVQTDSYQPFLVLTPTCLDDVVAFSDFLLEGWKALSSRFGDSPDMSQRQFMVRCLDAALCLDKSRRLFIFTSKNKKPLGFILVEDGSEGDERTTLFVYAAYSNGKFPKAPEAAFRFVRRWARLAGYAKVRLLSRRLNGSAMRLFRRRLGFSPVGVLFEQSVSDV